MLYTFASPFLALELRTARLGAVLAVWFEGEMILLSYQRYLRASYGSALCEAFERFQDARNQICVLGG